MADAEIFSHMRDLEFHLGSLRVQDPSFVTELSQLAWIPSAGGERRCVEDIYDPDNPVFHQFFPERLLPQVQGHLRVLLSFHLHSLLP